MGDKLSFVLLSHIYPLLFDEDSEDIECLLSEVKACHPQALIVPGDVIQGT